MTEYLIQDTTLTGIAEAIRGKTGETGTIPVPDMAGKIDGIQTGGGSDEGWIGDGNTHIWVHLGEGRTSPMLGCCPNGTVTVDWGDGTTPDVLTGTSTSTVKWTSVHKYAAAGDYIITLAVDGEMGFLGSSGSSEASTILRYAKTTNDLNHHYRNAVQKIELGNSVTSIGAYAFQRCFSLTSVTIPSSVTSIGNQAFGECFSLTSVTIPSSVTSIGNQAFSSCYALSSVTIPSSVTSIGNQAFSGCYTLSSVTMPSGVTSIGDQAFYLCRGLASVTIPSSVTSIGNQAFCACCGLAFADFTAHTAVPALYNTMAFSDTPADLKIRVPAALYDEWIAATNWSNLASKIVAV